MLEYLRLNAGQILDGLLFGLGVLAVYLGAVFTGALIRSLGGVGSKGLTSAGRYMQGWFFHLRGDDRDIVNVTINMIVDNHLKSTPWWRTAGSGSCGPTLIAPP